MFSNVTYVGRGSSAGKRTVTFRDNAGGEYHNSIFAEQAKGIDIEYRDNGSGSSTGQCSYSQWADAGILKLGNNIFQNIADGTASGIFKVVSEQDDNSQDLFTVPESAKTAFANYFGTAGNSAMDAGVDAENPTASGDIRGADFTGLDEWFTRVGYKGAFAQNKNWAAGWSLSLGNVSAKNNPNVSSKPQTIDPRTVEIYPNPMVAYSNVEFDNSSNDVFDFLLLDMSGRTVKLISGITSNRFVVHRENLKSGIYIYRLTDASGSGLEGKIVVQ